MEIITDLQNNRFKGIVIDEKLNCKGLMREKLKILSVNS